MCNKRYYFPYNYNEEKYSYVIIVKIFRNNICQSKMYKSDPTNFIDTILYFIKTII